MTAGIETIIGLHPLVTVLIKITALLLVGALLHFALARANPRWRVLAWRGIVVGILVLPLAEFAFPRIELEVAQAPVPPIVNQQPAVPATSLPEPVTPSYAVPAPTPAPPPTTTSAAAPEVSSPPVPFWATHRVELLLGAWAFLALGFALRLALAKQQLARMLNASRSAPTPICEAMESVAADLRCPKAPGLRVIPEASSPFLAGVFAPLLILPERMCEAAYAHERTAVFAHELAHLKGRDLFWLHAINGLTVLFWFHPLVWFLRAAHAAACEKVCDGVAADYVGDASDYSRTLARTTLDFVVDAATPPGVPMIRSAEITRRLRALKRGIRATALRRRWVATSITIGCIALVILGGLQFVYATKPLVSEEEAETIADALNDTNPEGVKNPDSATISGMARYEDTGEGAPGVVVHAYNEHSDQTYLTETDDEGRYELEIPDAGKRGFDIALWSEAKREGYRAKRVGDLFRLFAGDDRQGVDFVLLRNDSGISGMALGKRIAWDPSRIPELFPDLMATSVDAWEQVMKEELSPLARVRVVLVRTGQTDPYMSTTSDDEGHYAFTGCAPGKYTLRVIPPGTAPQIRDSFNESNKRVELEASEHLENVDLALSVNGVAVTGRVVDEAGNPIPAARVTADPIPRMDGAGGGDEFKSSLHTVPIHGLADADGRYRIEGLVPAHFKETSVYLAFGELIPYEGRTYTLRVDAAGYAPAEVMVRPIDHDMAQFFLAVFEEGRKHPAYSKEKPFDGPVKGSFLTTEGNVIPDMNIVLKREPDTTANTSRLQLRLEGDAEVLEYAKPTDDRKTLAVGETVYLTEADIKSAVAKEDPDQEGIYMVLFHLYEESAKRFGEFTSTIIGQKLVIIFDGKVLAAPTVRARMGASGNITGEFTKQEAQTIADALSAGFELPTPPPSTDPNKRFTAFGRVTDSDGRPMAGVEVRAATGFGTLLGGGTTTTAEDGTYTLRFGPGNWLVNDERRVVLQAAIITARKPGFYEENLSRHGHLHMSGTLPEEGNSRGATPENTILPQKPYRIDFIVAPATRMEGTLFLSANGETKPWPDKTFSMSGSSLPPASSILRTVTTDDQGRFVIENTPSFPFYFEVNGARSERIAFQPGADFKNINLNYQESPKRLNYSPLIEALVYANPFGSPASRKYSIDEFNIRAGFKLDRHQVALNEDINLTFFVTNISDEPIYIEVGSTRGDRDRFIRVHAVDENRDPVPDPGDGKNSGGKSWREKIEPGETYTEARSLNKWVQFEHAGRHAVIAKRMLYLNSTEELDSTEGLNIPIRSSISITIE